MDHFPLFQSQEARTPITAHSLLSDDDKARTLTKKDLNDHKDKRDPRVL
jgi:hypothetical protein